MADAAAIRNQALKKLGILATGQTAQAEVATDLDAAYTQVYAMLDSLSLTTWDFDEEVPDEFVIPVVHLVAGSRKDEYSVPNDRYARIKADEDKAVMTIKEMQASNVYKTPEAEYF
jgi:hypothetical protein